MASLTSVMAYLCAQYPNRDDLLLSRLVLMLYLADWKGAIQHGKQITSLEWQLTSDGPDAEDILATINGDPAFDVHRQSAAYGSQESISLNSDAAAEPSLTSREKETLDFVIASTGHLSPGKLDKLVFSTYPVLTQPNFASLDLVSLAQKYNREKQQRLEEKVATFDEG